MGADGHQGTLASKVLMKLILEVNETVVSSLKDVKIKIVVYLTIFACKDKVSIFFIKRADHLALHYLIEANIPQNRQETVGTNGCSRGVNC